jgi:predicted TIM-barrel fold metal-dependent hydrolase
MEDISTYINKSHKPISIKDYIFGNTNGFDCHANVIGSRALTDYPVFLDNSLIMAIDGYITSDKSNYDDIKQYCQKNKNAFVAAKSNDIDELEKIVNDFSNNIKAIGEVICYKKDVENELGNGKDYIYDNFDLVFEIAEKFDLPIFVHIDLIDEYSIKQLSKLLENNPNTNIVLCHLGINGVDDKTFAFEEAITLQHKYNNLWLELSWYAYDFIKRDYRKLALMDSDRLVLGTDFTKFDSDDKIKNTLSMFKYWSNTINKKMNMKKLLKI